LLLIDFITVNFSDNIHLFGNTGIGGIFAQYFMCSNEGTKIKSFAQFACLNYKDTAALGYPYLLVKFICPLLKLFPNMDFNFKVPKYTGFNAEKDNSFYELFNPQKTNVLKSKLGLISALLECAVSNKSNLKNGIKSPTLVFKVLHDRYFSVEHFDKYYFDLKCKKNIIEINDTHNSYYFSSDLFCNEAYKWFNSNSR
jgi:hypothetical protein